jgi:hypothetical protein
LTICFCIYITLFILEFSGSFTMVWVSYNCRWIESNIFDWRMRGKLFCRKCLVCANVIYIWKFNNKDKSNRKTAWNEASYYLIYLRAKNICTFYVITFLQKSSPTQYFWYRNTLEISDNVNNPDNFNWPIAACLLAAWCLVYLCIVKGITENPKIIYVTAIYPYVVLIIFFFRGITLEGCGDGIKHLFKPKVV